MLLSVTAIISAVMFILILVNVFSSPTRESHGNSVVMTTTRETTSTSHGNFDYFDVAAVIALFWFCKK